MKLTLEKNDGIHLIESVDAAGIKIDGQYFNRPFLVSRDLLQYWDIYSQPLDFRQGAARNDSESLQIVNEEANEHCNTAKNSSAKSIKTFADINLSVLENLVALKPEILLIGTGQTPLFLAPFLTVFVQQHGIGIETMATAAACRTYNVLRSENRNVLAAILC